MIKDLPKLPNPFFVLAPMDDVTDTVFRQLIAELAPPDLFFTEFVNVDALQSAGREAAMKRLRFTAAEKPLIAQIWGKTPENFYKTAQELAKMGFAGVDINFGCPDKNVVRNGACSAFILPANRGVAVDIIEATRKGAPSLPLSVKTRLGFNEIDFSWHELILQQKLNMLSIHGRTKKQMSNVPAQWEHIGEIRKLRDKLSPSTLIVGNGDVLTREQGMSLAKTHNLDGIMIGRGIFQDPFIFAKETPWPNYTREQRIALYKRHVELFAATWQNNERKIHTLNKFCKVYIQTFDSAKELREKLMAGNSTDELLHILN
ncbi:tRNA-dihydrouridine synthase [Candidatus Saccharibacteria bacterium]|nr:tRNA-dihydrouridine synthase [Candidatus Saccharibacteria bacterium]